MGVLPRFGPRRNDGASLTVSVKVASVQGVAVESWWIDSRRHALMTEHQSPETVLGSPVAHFGSRPCGTRVSSLEPGGPEAS